MVLSSKSSLNPEIWGNSIWETIHFVAFGYPENPSKEDKEVYTNFYDNLMKVLPCDTCSTSATQKFMQENLEYIFSSRDRLIKWTHSFHNHVNGKLNKDHLSFDDFKDIYKKKFTEEKAVNNEPSFLFHNIIIIMLILFILYILIIR